MIIVSLNINSFGGDKESFEEMKENLIKKKYGGKDSEEARKDALSRWNFMVQHKPIVECVEQIDADILLFQEYYINSSVAKKFEDDMKKRGYELNCNPYPDPKPLHTVAFCKEKTLKMDQFWFDGRIFVFGYKNFIIIDAHMPLNPKDNPNKNSEQLSEKEQKRADRVEKEWENIENYLRENKDRNVIFIGDLNVCARGTYQFDCFIRLFNNRIGMKDLWIESGNRDSVPTEKKHGARLDYALVTHELFNSSKCNITMIPQSKEDFLGDNWSISDHRMLVVEIEEEKSNGN